MRTSSGSFLVLLASSAGAQVPASLECVVVPEPHNTGRSEFGGDLAIGDANSDGFPDLCVGMAAKNGVGGAWILWGPRFSTGIEVQAPPSLGEGAGWTLHGIELGDLDRDGHLDLVTRSRDPDRPDVDRVWFVRGPEFNECQELGQPSTGVSQTLGHDTIIGDFDSDGVADVVMSQHLAPPEGAVALYRGAMGLRAAPQLFVAPSSPPLSVDWGHGLALFDLDRDGDSDIVTTQVGALGDIGQLVYFDFAGSAGAPNVLPTPSMSGTRCNVHRVAGIRFVDLDSDGFDDIVARGGPPYSVESGLAVNEDPTFFIARGPNYATGTCVQHADIAIGSSNFANRFDIGDVNRDGAMDLVAGDSYAHLPQFDAVGRTSTDGRVTILYGPDFRVQQTIDSIHPEAGLGHDVKVVDLEGDGFSELIVGAPGADAVLLYRHASLRALSAPTVSAAAGGTVLMSLECGRLSANEDYLLLASLSGESPGIDLPAGSTSIHLPLGLDMMTSIGLASIQTPYFQQFQGQLDSDGTGLAQFSVPASMIPATAAGLQFSFAALTFGGGGGVRFATNSLSVTVTP